MRDELSREINTRELEIFRMKADRSPSETISRLELGIRLLRAGQIDEAITELQIVRKDERLQAKACLHLGHCFKARNNWRLAQRNFEEALQKLPAADEAGRKEILFELANGTAADGDLGKAIDYAHELANLDFAYRDINRLMDEWHAKLQKA
jgi:tetratricopeptide (TPR) repeat protein